MFSKHSTTSRAVGRVAGSVCKQESIKRARGFGTLGATHSSNSATAAERTVPSSLSVRSWMAAAGDATRLKRLVRSRSKAALVSR